VGFLDSLLGRSKPARPDLDQLFGLPSAGVTLEAALDFRSTGTGSVAFRAAEGRAFADVQADVQALLDAGQGPKVEVEVDSFGYTWLVCRTDPPDLSSLVTDLHAVNTTLQDSGFGPTLLCSLASFTDGTRTFALVYLFKRGTFYPFAPAQASGTTVEGKRRGSATTCSRCSCATCSRMTCGSSPSSPAGSPSGEHPASRPARDHVSHRTRQLQDVITSHTRPGTCQM